MLIATFTYPSTTCCPGFSAGSPGFPSSPAQAAKNNAIASIVPPIFVPFVFINANVEMNVLSYFRPEFPSPAIARKFSAASRRPASAARRKCRSASS